MFLGQPSVLWKTVMSVSPSGQKKGRGANRQKMRPIEHTYTIGSSLVSCRAAYRSCMLNSGPLNVQFPGLNSKMNASDEDAIRLVPMTEAEREAKVNPMRAFVAGMTIRFELSRRKFLSRLYSFYFESSNSHFAPKFLISHQKCKNQSLFFRKRRITQKLHPLERGFTGRSIPGMKLGPPPALGDVTFNDFETYCLQLRRVCHMDGTVGRLHSSQALVVTGNGRGTVGYAAAKAAMMRPMLAVIRAMQMAAKRLFYVQLLEERTIYQVLFVNRHSGLTIIAGPDFGLFESCNSGIGPGPSRVWQDF